MDEDEHENGTSTELTGGAGFGLEDAIVAYYLAALLREENTAPGGGIVEAVAVQQNSHGFPMDDLIVHRGSAAPGSTLGLQVKTKVVVSVKNNDFKDILNRAARTRASDNFRPEDQYGFAAAYVADSGLRPLQRLIDWARASSDGPHFEKRFEKGGSAAAAERSLRDSVRLHLSFSSTEEERTYWAAFVAIKLDLLTPDTPLRNDVINRLGDLTQEAQGLLLFDRLCRIARDGAGNAQRWTRESLLALLRDAVRLKTVPRYQHDIDRLNAFSQASLEAISDSVADFSVERPNLEQAIVDQLSRTRLVNITGLPGCGKSAVLKKFVSKAIAQGPVAFLKSDRLEGKSWLTFSTALGLQHVNAKKLFAEIGATGTPILFIDGVDRVHPDQRKVISDLISAIESSEYLSNWKVVATTRDQGVEPYRTWFSRTFYSQNGIGEVKVGEFSDDESSALAERFPTLQPLLFGNVQVREIARRAFFAAVLVRDFSQSDVPPQTEVDLIRAWWTRAGHDAGTDAAPRQRALLDIAIKGARNLGKRVPAASLSEATFSHISNLKADLLIRDHEDGASYSFSHDIFFEWVFYRRLIELGDAWHQALGESGEAPLLGRVVNLLAQSRLNSAGQWSKGYRSLEQHTLRSQWRREWLTAPPFNPTFEQGRQEYEALLKDDNFALLEKLLVWFQAQHTTPSPAVLTRPAMAGFDRAQAADLLAWPSDIPTWRRLLEWLLPLVPAAPIRLRKHVLTVMAVWQNMLGDIRNSLSQKIVLLAEAWLIELEQMIYADSPTFEASAWRELNSEARDALASSLQLLIVRSARAYLAPAVALFRRAAANERIRDRNFTQLMSFTPIMAEVAPEAVAALTKAALLEELPGDRAERRRREQEQKHHERERIRGIPASKRTPSEKATLGSGDDWLLHGGDHSDISDFGIDRHNNHFFPPSALREPFPTLLTTNPEAGLSLIKDIINHGTRGWRQAQGLLRQGTPVPIKLQFPWGEEEVWGDWSVYQWFCGFAPQPIECAFMALRYWAFKQLEGGRPADEVVKAVISDSECVASAGLALTLALESLSVSQTSLPLASCQRLWSYDIARSVQPGAQHFDFMGIGALTRAQLSKDELDAEAFLDQRVSNRRDVRQLAVLFAHADEPLRGEFKCALEQFPDHLPIEREEQQSDHAYIARLSQQAVQWAGLGDARNYTREQVEGDKVAVSYSAPIPLSAQQQSSLANSSKFLEEQAVIGWAMQSLRESKLHSSLTLAQAVPFAKLRDSANLLETRIPGADHTAQTAVSAIAAVVAVLGSECRPSDHTWAWDVLDRVEGMKEPEGEFRGANIPWHPSLFLIKALVSDRCSTDPRSDSAQRLFTLTTHKNEEVCKAAFAALLTDHDVQVSWIAGLLALEGCIQHRAIMLPDGTRDITKQQFAASDSLERAIKCLTSGEAPVAPEIPAPWTFNGRVEGTSGRHDVTTRENWRLSDPFFDAQRAAKLVRNFPVETWCLSHKNAWAEVLAGLCSWTGIRLIPPWTVGTRRDTNRRDLHEWPDALGHLIARTAPYFAISDVKQLFIGRFLADCDEALEVLQPFTSWTVLRHVMDAPVIPANTMDLLNLVVDRVIADRAFRTASYRSDEVRGREIAQLIRALLFINFDQHAAGASRFANGDWSDINQVIPIVTKLCKAIGWSLFVAERLMTLREKVGDGYPIDAFTDQILATLDGKNGERSTWVGSSVISRIAASVQRLADANSPLNHQRAQSLLRILDRLIDLGDRRSAALEQTEAFKGVQLQ